MTRDEATTILTGLTAAFPNVRLESDTPDVWRKHLSALDFDVADRAVGQCVSNLKFFPSVAEFKEFYRLERHNSPKPTPRLVEGDDIPTWVHVWRWQLDRTLEARQEARDSKLPVDERHPVKMREFPQLPNPDENAYSWEDYAQMEAEWVGAGSPRFGAAEILQVIA